MTTQYHLLTMFRVLMACGFLFCVRALGQHLPSSPDALPLELKGGWVPSKQILKVSVSRHTHSQALSPGTGTLASCQKRVRLAQSGAILQPHLQVSLPNEGTGCTGTPLGHCSSCCRPCLVGQFAPVVVKSSTELKLLGIPFRHSIQMASGCSAQAPPFTHPGTQLTHVGTQPRHRLSPLMFGPFAMKHFV